MRNKIGLVLSLVFVLSFGSLVFAQGTNSNSSSSTSTSATSTTTTRRHRGRRHHHRSRHMARRSRGSKAARNTNS